MILINLTTTAKMNSHPLFEFYIEHTQSETTRQTLWKKLLDEKIIGINSSFGGTAQAKLQQAVAQSEKNADMPKVYTSVSVELADIYKDKKRNVGRIFTISIIAISLGIILLLAGLSISFLQKSEGQTGIITSASGIITTFLSATFFWLYKKENIKLAAIENDIKKIKVLEGFASIASNMQNDTVVNAAYRKIITQMDL